MKNKYLIRVIGLAFITFISIILTMVFALNSVVGINYEIFLLPIFNIIVTLVHAILPRYRIIFKGEKDAGFSIVSIIMVCLFSVMQLLILLEHVGYNIDIWKFSIVLVGCLIILCGNYFPKLQQNNLFAIYNSWTIADKRVWRKTHRFAGYLWVLGGISIVFTALLNNIINLWITLIIIGVLIITPIIYSMIYYKYKVKEKND